MFVYFLSSFGQIWVSSPKQLVTAFEMIKEMVTKMKKD